MPSTSMTKGHAVLQVDLFDATDSNPRWLVY